MLHRLPFRRRAVLAVALVPVLCLLVAPRAKAAQPWPSEPLQEAYFAWDEGRYVAALEGYLEVLTGPEGKGFVQETARLTGELHPTRQVDEDGRSLAISPDGRFLQWSRERADGWVTHVEPVVGGERRSFPTRVGALSTEGLFAWVHEETVRVEPVAGGEVQEVFLPGGRPLALTFAPDRPELYVTAARSEDDEERVRIFRVAGPDWDPELLELGDGHHLEPQPAAGGGYLVFYRAERSGSAFPGDGPDPWPATPGPGLLELETGRVLSFRGRAPTVSADGSAVAWFQEGEEGGATRLRLLSLPANGLPATPPEPVTLLEAEVPVGNPALSPEGRRVAYQARPHLDWEIFVVAWDGNGIARDPLRLTREIQHDQFPAWVGAELVLAMKGEFRHRRAYLYALGENGETAPAVSPEDPAGARGYRLHHNNTLRTIAPEYEWVPDPRGRGVFLSAERDGDTIAPERAVFWVDLTRTVTHPELVSRLETALEAERELLARGEERLAPEADQIRAAADAVSTGRIYTYARELHAFGPKFFTEPGNALARDYLARTLEGWGYEVELQWFEARSRQPDAVPARTANVVATLPGTENPEQVYVISSHFDSVLGSPGADDNSSGTTALLEAARVLADRPRLATIQFAFLTAEEAGLLGAREFVRRALEGGVHIAGVLNNDMIGWTRSHRLDNTIRYSNDGIRDIQHAAAHLFSDLITYDARYYRGTDAAVFFDAYGDIVGGIGSYPVLGNPNYHQATDELWTINQRLVAEVSRTTVATIMHLADGPSLVENLHLADRDAEGLVFAWQEAPEAMVTHYRVRVRIGESEWVELDPVDRPRVRVPAALDPVEIVVRAVSADGRSSYDDRRLTREDGW